MKGFRYPYPSVTLCDLQVTSTILWLDGHKHNWTKWSNEGHFYPRFPWLYLAINIFSSFITPSPNWNISTLVTLAETVNSQKTNNLTRLCPMMYHSSFFSATVTVFLLRILLENCFGSDWWYKKRVRTQILPSLVNGDHYKVSLLWMSGCE